MVVAARLRQRLGIRLASPSVAELEKMLPLLVAGAVVVGLAVVAVATPIAGRGDYGQWLMTSRHYLGESVPDYRVIGALPPVVPALLAAIRVAVDEGVVALHVLNTLLLTGMGLGLYALGAVLLRSRWAGAATLCIGMLGTDRFMELFAFGGLLQAAALLLLAVSVAAFAHAARADGVDLRWWLAGTAAMAVAALSHVGTGLIAVPLGLTAAALAAVSLRHVGWRTLARALVLPSLAVVMVGVYWLGVLVPASDEYVTNPASLAYRGPDRLFSALFSYWPTTLVVLIGGAALTVGLLASVARRALDGFAYLVAWAAVSWGALLYSAASGAATDYPRFATLLLVPFVVAAAGAFLWLARALGGYLATLRRTPQTAMAPLLALGLLLPLAPIAVDRYGRQADVYQPRDAHALTAAVQWVDQALSGSRVTVLTEVRDGKWLEGLTGREALFSQPVRYAFRPIEWRRSADANALLRSSDTVTSGIVTAAFTDLVGSGSRRAPADLLISVNHGGEMVDVLQLHRSGIQLRHPGRRITVDRMQPVRAGGRTTADEASITTVWAPRDQPERELVQRVTTYRDGATLRISHQSYGRRVRTILRPVSGAHVASLDVRGAEAVVCRSPIGGKDPCVRVWLSQSGARLRAADDGAVVATSRRAARFDVLVTALTAGEAAVDLARLTPAEIVAAYDVGAALLHTLDPASESRQRRLEAVGFQEARHFGPYVVLLRQDLAPG